jgi:hypothetical protein
MMNSRRNGRKRLCGLFQGTIPVFVWVEEGVTTKILSGIVGVPDEIRTGNLQNTSQKRYRLSHPTQRYWCEIWPASQRPQYVPRLANSLHAENWIGQVSNRKQHLQWLWYVICPIGSEFVAAAAVNATVSWAVTPWTVLGNLALLLVHLRA